MTSVDEALRQARTELEAAGIENARTEARLLLGHTLNLSAARILSRGQDDVDAGAFQSFQSDVTRRAGGMPLAYITGIREFWSLALAVTPATLIPRPDSETLVELAVDLFKGRAGPETILDLGTGSGCLLLALLTEYREARGLGIDLSAAACLVARGNALALGLALRSEWMAGSWSECRLGKYNLIVSNPPYIPAGDIASLDVSVRNFEPDQALDGGADGLDAYRSLFPVAAMALKDDGLLVVEIGIGQHADVAGIAVANGLSAGPVKADLAGIERALSFYKKGVGISESTR
ncbi:MAG: peptide chain release factor N(5)-glutamine methyltransferase [Rhodospirillales bacterium]